MTETKTKAKKFSASIDERGALWHLMNRTARLITKARERELRKHHITVDTAMVLFTVMRQGLRATPATLARELLLEPHSVSEQLTRMEKEGLIRRLRDLERKNLVRIEVTEEGYKAYRNSARRRSTTTVMSELTSEEREALWGLLARLRARAMKRLKIEDTAVYPPSDIGEFRAGLRG